MLSGFPCNERNLNLFCSPQMRGISKESQGDLTRQTVFAAEGREFEASHLT